VKFQFLFFVFAIITVDLAFARAENRSCWHTYVFTSPLSYISQHYTAGIQARASSVFQADGLDRFTLGAKLTVLRPGRGELFLGDYEPTPGIEYTKGLNRRGYIGGFLFGYLIVSGRGEVNDFSLQVRPGVFKTAFWENVEKSICFSEDPYSCGSWVETSRVDGLAYEAMLMAHFSRFQSLPHLHLEIGAGFSHGYLTIAKFTPEIEFNIGYEF